MVPDSPFGFEVALHADVDLALGAAYTQVVDLRVVRAAVVDERLLTVVREQTSGLHERRYSRQICRCNNMLTLQVKYAFIS